MCAGPRMSSARRWLAALVLLGAASMGSCKVLMVYSVQRHGARNVLSKTATLKETDAAGGPTLLPEGQRQAWSAGMAFRERYLANATTCATGLLCLDAALGNEGPEYGVVATPEGSFNNFNTLVRSSALDRTIMTARSFLDAVFPPINQPTDNRYLPDGQQVVPVYSIPDDNNPLIRGYTACPAYDSRLMAWYSSEEFQAKSEETVAFRDGIAAMAPGLNTSLANWWNVYDGFNVYRTYNVGTPLPTIDDATFSEMQQLAFWLETSKMRSELTGNLLSGLMLADLLSYINAAVAATSAANKDLPAIYYKLVHISSHYNTQLGLLGALGIDQYPGAAGLTWLRKIPSLAALLAFELHGSNDGGELSQELAVRLVMQDDPAANYTTIPLPCATEGTSAEALAGTGACSLDAFQLLVQPRAINSIEAWCSACQNVGMTACKLHQATAQLAAASATAMASSAGSGLSGGAVAGIAVGCVAAVAAVGGVAFAFYHRRMMRRLEQTQLALMHQPGFASMSA